MREKILSRVNYGIELKIDQIKKKRVDLLEGFGLLSKSSLTIFGYGKK